MRTPVKHWLVSVPLDAAIAYAFYLWQVDGIAAAGRCVLFVAWFGAIVGLTLLFCKPEAQERPTGSIFRAYSALTSIIFLAALIWSDHMVAASFYCAGFLGCVGHRAACDALAKQRAA